MRNLIKLEYKRMWNRVSIVSLISLTILSILLAIVTLNLQYRTIDENGEMVLGLPAFRTLKEVAEDLEGEIDDEYLSELIEKYNTSFAKEYLEENRGFTGTGGMTKYQISNYLINYAYYSAYMSNGNEKLSLDYDFLDSAKSFYERYKLSLLEQLLLENEWNGLKPYTEEQISILEQKIENIKTPFRVEYHTGWDNIIAYFGIEYPVFLALLAFCMASVFAKDSVNGIDELSLSTKYGRNDDMSDRWIAGNLFAITAYLIFVGALIIIHGAIASLHGLDASIQSMFFDSVYSINVGMGLMIIFLGGLLGILVMANIVMLLSLLLKKTKISTIAGICVLVCLLKQVSTYSQIKMFNPIQFKEYWLIRDYFFIGNIPIPYYMIVFVLSIIYIGICQIIMRYYYKKYRIN